MTDFLEITNFLSTVMKIFCGINIIFYLCTTCTCLQYINSVWFLNYVCWAFSFYTCKLLVVDRSDLKRAQI